MTIYYKLAINCVRFFGNCKTKSLFLWVPNMLQLCCSKYYQVRIKNTHVLRISKPVLAVEPIINIFKLQRLRSRCCGLFMKLIRLIKYLVYYRFYGIIILVKSIFTLTALSISLLALVSCGGSDKSDTTSEIETTSARSAVIATIRAGGEIQKRAVARKSFSLGPYISIYLSQNQMIRALSALNGIDDQIRLARSDSQETDETYVLLEDYGTVLQVNIVDTLNRSVRRDEAMEKYLETLRRMNARMDQKKNELEQKRDVVEDSRREQKRKVSDVERIIRNALKDKDYAQAGPKQEELTKLAEKLTQIESHEKQINDKLDIVKELLKVGEERLEAIEKNKEVLIAGLKVTDSKGLEDLGIFIED